jgi:hypothetical protein
MLTMRIIIVLYIHSDQQHTAIDVYSEHVVSLARNKLQPDIALGEETERYWSSEIATKRHQFSSLASEITALQTVTQADIVALCKDWFGDSSSSSASSSSSSGANKSKSKAKSSKSKAQASKNSSSASSSSSVSSSSKLGRLTVLIVGAKRSVAKETAALQTMFSGSSSELTFVADIHAMRSQGTYYPVLIADT